MFYLTLALYVLTTSAGLITLKLGSDAGAFVEFVAGKIIFNFTLMNIIGVILYGLSFVLYLYLIAKNDLGYIIPLTTALVYIIIFIASYVIFKETFTILKIVGISLIVVGLIILNLKK